MKKIGNLSGSSDLSKVSSLAADEHPSGRVSPVLYSGSMQKKRPVIAQAGSHGLKINDAEFAAKIERYSLEDIVELKIARFLDQLGEKEPEDIYALIITQIERPLLVQMIRRAGGNQVHAAKLLGINRNTLRKKMKEYQLS